MNLILVFIAALCLLGAIAGIRSLHKKHDARGVLVVVIWFALFVLAVYPDSAQSLTRVLGVGENLNTLIFIGFVFLFYLLFRLFNKVETVQSNITQLTRAHALNEFKSDLAMKEKKS